MSSATSTDTLPAKAGSSKRAAEAGSAGQPADDGFRVSHFFILLSLVAATVAVVMARPSAPENLILISLTIGAAGLAAVAFYRTVAPLVTPGYEEEREPLSARLRADLDREKALTLRSIKELEFDRAMGKVSEKDFEQMAGRLRARALGIMKQLDAGASAYRQQIEKELAARMGTPGLKTRPAPDQAKRDLQDERRPDLQVRQCICGTPNDADARFCKACGKTLAVAS
jgi:hypothetical protein